MFSASYQVIESLLDNLMVGLQELIECLQQEREAIIEWNLKRINTVEQKKHALLSRVANLEKSRKSATVDLAKALGQPANARLGELIDLCSDKALAQTLQHRLSCVRSMAQAAQEFNEVQRQYLVHSLENVQASLHLLDSLQGNGQFNAYNRQGVREGQSQSSTSTVNRAF